MSPPRCKRIQINISDKELLLLSSPGQTVDVALASEPGLDWPGRANDLQALDQILSGENVSLFIKNYAENDQTDLAVQREAVTPPVIHTGNGLQTLWMEGSQGSLGLEIRIDFDA